MENSEKNEFYKDKKQICFFIHVVNAAFDGERGCGFIMELFQHFETFHKL